MNAERLLHAFSMIGEDPARIQQWRQIAVALAISGKLNSDSAALLPQKMLRAIEQLKVDLYKRRAIPKPKNLKTIEQNDLPDNFPDAARFVPLGSLARVEKGLTGIKQAKPGPFPLVVTGAERATCDHFDFDGAAAIIPLVSSTGHGHASLNRLHYQEGKFALGTILAAVFPYDPAMISARFIFEYLTAFKEELLVARMTGTANVTLSVGRIEEVPLPLIEPETQAKLDELMARLDQLEAARISREAIRDRLTAASLAPLSSPKTTAEDFPTQVRFALAKLPALTARPDQIKALRQTILNLAVCGKLVRQDANDEPASELLRRIAKEKEKLRLKKGLRAQKAVIPANTFETKVEIPETWQHVYLQDISYQITDGTHLTPKYTERGRPFLSAQNIKPFRFIPEIHRFVSQEDFDNYRANRRPERGDILLTRVGAGIGEAAVLDSDFEFAFYVSLCLIKIPNELMNVDYLAIWLNSPEGRESSLVRTYGRGASQGNLNLSLIRTFKIPLPPLAEQHRIVAKVDALMTLCDRLEAALAAAETTRARLLEALLKESLAAAASELEAAE